MRPEFHPLESERCAHALGLSYFRSSQIKAQIKFHLSFSPGFSAEEEKWELVRNGESVLPIGFD